VPGRQDCLESIHQHQGVLDCWRRNCKCSLFSQNVVLVVLDAGNSLLFLHTTFLSLLKNFWSGRIEVIGYESYDSRLAIEALSSGFWLDNMYAGCRTGVPLGLPAPASATRLEGSGFYWYDTGQSHIITNSVFEHCGFRSPQYDQYDASPDRGCGDEADDAKGCHSRSTVFGFITHHDRFTPEIMQGTSGISYVKAGRRFRFTRDLVDTVSGRGQNWLDVDGSASGMGVPTLIGSGLASVRDWWGVEDEPERKLIMMYISFAMQQFSIREAFWGRMLSSN